MMIMSETLSFVAPLVLLGITALLPSIRRYLERLSREASVRDEFVEEFHQNAMKLFKATDPATHSEVREIVRETGSMMMDGTKFIRVILFYKGKKSSASDKRRNRQKEVLDSLSDDAKHALAKSFGAALLVSSCNSPLFGRLYRSILLLILSADDKEVKEPAELMGRFKRGRSVCLGGGGQAA